MNEYETFTAYTCIYEHLLGITCCVHDFIMRHFDAALKNHRVSEYKKIKLKTSALKDTV